MNSLFSGCICINPHSVVDLITNSSTVIFTYQNSTEQCKELVQEMINIWGPEGLTADDVFFYGEYHSVDTYLDAREQYEDEDEDEESNEYAPRSIETGDQVLEIIHQVMRGEISAPSWLHTDLTNYEEFPEDIYLYLVPKDDKYIKLAEKIKNFLDSPDHEGSYG